MHYRHIDCDGSAVIVVIKKDISMVECRLFTCVHSSLQL